MASIRSVTTSTDQEVIDNLTTKLSVAANKVVDYLQSRLQSDGSFGEEAKDIACYFKSPMMFLIAGRPQIAKVVLRHIRLAFMTNEGDFRTSESLKSVNGAYIQYWTYTNGWIIRAANRLNLVDISEKGNRYLTQYNLDEAGFSTHEINKFPRVSDVLTVAHHGLINFEMGNLEVAISAGEYLCRALEKQELDLNGGFYLRQNQERNLIREKTPFYFISATEPNQLHFMIGYPAAYLAILYKKTEKQEFLTAAKAYLDFSLSCHKSVYACDYSHKIAWAASLIYECTGDSNYLSVIDRIATYFIEEKQQANGMLFTDDINTSYDQSAEVACWFLDIVNNINALKKKLHVEEKVEKPKQHKSWTRSAITYGVIALAAGVGLAILKSKTSVSSDAAVIGSIKPSRNIG